MTMASGSGRFTMTSCASELSASIMRFSAAGPSDREGHSEHALDRDRSMTYLRVNAHVNT